MRKDYISKRALAHEYFPDAEHHVAVNHLMRWINRCTPLLKELQANGYHTRKRYFSPIQRERVYDFLGDPYFF